MNTASVYRMASVSAALGILLITGFVVVTPFIPALLLAIIFTLSTWPAYSWLERYLKNRRTAAATLMTLLLASCFLLPILFLGNSLADHFMRLTTVLTEALQSRPKQPPSWLQDVPYVKDHLDDLWSRYVEDTAFLTKTLKTSAGPMSQWLIGVGGTVGRGVADLSFGVLITFFLFRHGVEVAKRLRVLIDKSVGPRGRHLLKISENTIVSVVYGMLGTALAQATMAGIGFWIAGVPGAAFLALVTFVLSFLPMGPPLVWVPAAIWLFSEQQVGMGIFMAVWGLLAISSIDNFIRPYFISRGNKMPLLLVLLGVFGGILAFGFIGLFIGPTVLAVIYTLVMEWSNPRLQARDALPEDAGRG